jgi:uncharacterized protein (TIGR02266 family)
LAALTDGTPLSLAIVDAGLSPDPEQFVRRLRASAATPLPVVVFAGTVPSAADVVVLSALGVTFVNEHAATSHILPALAPHLYPDNFNRRAGPRVVLGVPITYHAGETIAGSVTLNLGKGGLAIRTLTPQPTGSTFGVKFRLPGQSADIEAMVRVAWSDRKVGMGVQFERLSSADQRAIDAYVDARL